MKHRPTSFAVTLARLENERADAPYSRSRMPRRGLKPGWNLEDTPAAHRADCHTAPDLPAASIARLKRLKTLAQGSAACTVERPPCPPARIFHEERKVPMPFNPPRFKVLKKGPRAGKTVEETWCLRMITRTVVIPGIQTWTATARIDKNGSILPPSSARVGTPPAKPDPKEIKTLRADGWSRDEISALYPPDLRPSRSFSRVQADLKSRYGPAEADRLTAFLRFA
jgi:hypothetical protein